MMKRNIKNILTLCAALLELSLCLSCKSDKPALKREKVTTKLFHKEKIIRIACANGWENNDTLQWEGLQFACHEINSSGGVDGAKIELIQFDDHDTEKEGLYAAYDISNRYDIAAVIGHTISGIAVESSKVYQYYGVLMFSPMATATKLTNQGFPYVFRNIPRAAAFAKAASNFCKEKGWNRMIIYYLDTPYGEDISNAFEFDAVFLAGDMPQLENVIKTMRENGMDKPILGPDTFDHPGLEKWIMENNIRDIYAVTSFGRNASSDAYTKFKNDFSRIYGKSPAQQAVQGYESLKILTGAMEKAHSVKAKDVAAELRKNTWTGLNGKYYFNKRGDIIGTNIFVLDFNELCDTHIAKMKKVEESQEEEE